MKYFALTLQSLAIQNVLVYAKDIDKAAEELATHLKVSVGEANRAIIGSVDIPEDRVWGTEGKTRRCIYSLDILKLGFECADQKA